MKNTHKSQVNRCFGERLKSDKPKALPPPEKQREEKIKRILFAADERKRTRRQKKVLRALLGKAAEQKKAKTLKKVAAKEIPKERDLMREGAEHLVSGLKKASRDGSLMDLLPMVSRKVREGEHDAIVLKVLIERIRRNQWDKLSTDDQMIVNRMEDSMTEQTV